MFFFFFRNFFLVFASPRPPPHYRLLTGSKPRIRDGTWVLKPISTIGVAITCSPQHTHNFRFARRTVITSVRFIFNTANASRFSVFINDTNNIAVVWIVCIFFICYVLRWDYKNICLRTKICRQKKFVMLRDGFTKQNVCRKTFLKRKLCQKIFVYKQKWLKNICLQRKLPSKWFV